MSRRLISCSVIVAALVMTITTGPISAKPPKGGGGGSDTIANPAFAFQKSWDPALYLLTYDGREELQITKPTGTSEDASASWSLDGSQIAFFRKPEFDAPPQNLCLLTLKNPQGQVVTGAGDVIDAGQSTVDVLIEGFRDANGPSWSPTGEILFSDWLDLYVVDPLMASPVANPLLGLTDVEEDRQLLIPPGFLNGDEIRLSGITDVAVQPSISSNDKVLIAFVASWQVWDQGLFLYAGGDVFLVELDVVAGQLTANAGTFLTIMNVSNPFYDQVGPAPGYTGAPLEFVHSQNPGWSHDGRQLGYVQHLDLEAVNVPSESQIVAYDVVNWTYAPIVFSDPNDDTFGGPVSRPSWSPDGFEIALGEPIKVRNGTTYDILVMPSFGGFLISDETLVTNVTSTLSQRKREAAVRWRPIWLPQ